MVGLGWNALFKHSDELRNKYVPWWGWGGMLYLSIPMS